MTILCLSYRTAASTQTSSRTEAEHEIPVADQIDTGTFADIDSLDRIGQAKATCQAGTIIKVELPESLIESEFAAKLVQIAKLQFLQTSIEHRQVTQLKAPERKLLEAARHFRQPLKAVAISNQHALDVRGRLQTAHGTTAHTQVNNAATDASQMPDFTLSQNQMRDIGWQLWKKLGLQTMDRQSERFRITSQGMEATEQSVETFVLHDLKR